ncbi:MAG: hypothetical protein ACK5JH_00865 [Anaerocolumna sp.]
MKKWNMPEVTELNISETANGIFDSKIEFWWVLNDDKKTTPPEVEQQS